jgi:alkylation response protein AidB-like acyl-CoA dehydrogenase
MAQGGGSFMSSFGAHTGIGSLPIVFFGTKDQKKRYLPKMATGEIIGAYALTEPEAGSDALNSKTTATLSPDGKYYILNGQKQFITNAGFAGTFVTYAKVDGDKFTSFIVERNFEGVSLDEEENKMGVKGSSTRGVIFSDVKVPVENLLGEIGKGHIVALNVLNIARFSLGAGCVGGAKSALQEAVTYAKKRIQQAHCRVRSDQTKDCRDGNPNLRLGKHGLPNRGADRSGSPARRPPGRRCRDPNGKRNRGI